MGCMFESHQTDSPPVFSLKQYMMGGYLRPSAYCVCRKAHRISMEFAV